MKKILSGTITVIILSLLITACKKDTVTNPPPPEVNTGYFPNGDGSAFSYSVEKTDSNGTQTTGTRKTYFNGTEVKDGTTYQVQVDSLNLSSANDISFSYFRKTDGGVFYYLDTTGLSAYIPAIYLPYLNFDSELRELFFPLDANSSWPVFKLIIDIPLSPITIIDVEAAYDGTESLTLQLNTGDETKDATRVKYTLSVFDPENSTSTGYVAYAWFVDGIGVVKWQGNASILNAFSGGGIDLTDTTSVVTQSLISYNVK
jgi:hypothetical protein